MTKTAESKEVAIVEKKLSPVNVAAEKLVVKDEKTKVEATTMLSELNKIGDLMKEKKAKVYDPAWATVVAIRAEWKPKEDMLAAAIALVRGKMTKYQTEQVRLAREEEAKIAARVGEGKGKLKVDTAVRQMENIDRPSDTVSTASGAVEFVDTPVVDIEPLRNIQLINFPGDSLQQCIKAGLIVWDEVEVRRQVKAAKTSNIPGIVYRIEQRPKNFR